MSHHYLIFMQAPATSFWAAEVYEHNDGKFEVFDRDESIPMQVDGLRLIERN